MRLDAERPQVDAVRAGVWAREAAQALQVRPAKISNLTSPPFRACLSGPAASRQHDYVDFKSQLDSLPCCVSTR